MFDTSLFAGPEKILLGALTGFIFGFLLQKGGLTRFEVITGQFLLKDFTVIKVMVTAIVVGGAGIYAFSDLGLLDTFHIKATHLFANALGGLIFGAGMAILGYCPGTGVAAIGTGSRHAIPGVLGMLVGAALYSEAHPWFSAHVLSVGALGKATLPSVTHLSPWIFLAALAVAALLLFAVLERRDHLPPRRLQPRTS